MSVRLVHGWIMVDYSGHDLAKVEIGVRESTTHWRPAFLDYDSNGQRVAKIKNLAPYAVIPSSGHRVPVYTRINNDVSLVGYL